MEINIENLIDSINELIMINRAYIEIAKIYSEYYSLENSQLSNINFLFEQILKNQDILIDSIDELTRHAK